MPVGVAAFSTAILVSVASCAVFGAVLLLPCDLLARTLLPPQELPIGIITSSVGAFFVVTMLIRNRL
jgi:iron complex transport system permease protein